MTDIITPRYRGHRVRIVSRSAELVTIERVNGELFDVGVPVARLQVPSRELTWINTPRSSGL